MANVAFPEATGRRLEESDRLVRARTPAQLAWRQLRKHRMALIGGIIVVLLYFVTIFGEFFAPYSLDFTDRSKFYHPPTPLRFVDDQGQFSLRPFVYGTHLADPATRRYETNADEKYYVRFFVRGEPYRLLFLIPTNIHFFGVDEPGRIFLMGTDQFGRDLLSRVLIGGRISMFLGVFVLMVSLPIGVIYGAISGYFGGRVDNVMMRIAEIVIAFPEFYLLLALAAVLPPQIPSTTRLVLIVVIISFVGWGGLARLVRGMVLSLRTQEYVLAARASGAGTAYILRRHVIPNTATLLIVVATLSIPGAMIAEAALSFFGLGIREPQASWGQLLNVANNLTTLTQSPWLLWPGAFIVVAVVGYNLLGDGLRDALDPRLRTS
ncbi:MAG: ABC transporter permease [Armatimonadota bacterium]|nr:ABC transporter permease [Armatimonadota bacterium]